MDCPVCDAEVCDRDTESCTECGTPLAIWDECDLEFYARPLVRCCRCGECPSPGDRACRQCLAHFFKRAPSWLDAEFPGWTEAGVSFECVSCDGNVPVGRATCGTCELSFFRPTTRALQVVLDVDELADIIMSQAKVLFGIDFAQEMADCLAQMSQGTVATAIYILTTVVVMIQDESNVPITGETITGETVWTAIRRMGRDPWAGLDRLQRKYLVALAGEGGRDLSAVKLAAMCNEKVSTIETIVEPFLMQRSSLPDLVPRDGQWPYMASAFVECTGDERRPTGVTYKYLEMAQVLQGEDPEWFVGEDLSFSIATVNALEVNTDDFEYVPNSEPENGPAPLVVATPKSITASKPATAKPTTVSVRRPVYKSLMGKGVTAVAAMIAPRIIPQRTRLLTERQASYKALLANGSIRPVPSVTWLSGQSVVCTHGHRSNFGLFACRPDYGTLDCLPDFNELGRHNRLAAAFHVQSGTTRDNINDRDPEHDVHWSLGCPVCGTGLYTFEAAALQNFVMCTASADCWWMFCHLYRRDMGVCGNCEIRRVYWDTLRSLE